MLSSSKLIREAPCRAPTRRRCSHTLSLWFGSVCVCWFGAGRFGGGGLMSWRLSPILLEKKIQ